VHPDLKQQEMAHQDLTTWNAEVGATILFDPSWEILPHEDRLPHVDVISERLETLVFLSQSARPMFQVATNVHALLQRTFDPAWLKARTRRVRRGDRIEPLDLVEWLEEQGYEPEAQVNHKGELALRGGILDIFPPTCPWPVRLEFFGDEVESMRQFDPVAQTSREEVAEVAIPPAGELGLLRRRSGEGANLPARTLLDYLPLETLIVTADPEQVRHRAEEYASRVLPGDALYVSWEDFRSEALRRGHTLVDLPEGEPADDEIALESLDAFRPIGSKAPDAQVAETQRREFFVQMHRWLRQGFGVHVFCNNQGERQRFEEIWSEYHLDEPGGPVSRPAIHLGTLAQGFCCPSARAVAVSDAEIFGRYKVQRPRRLKSPHAPSMRSALDIDFAELEEGDYVVHLQHGIGRYQGLTQLPAGAGTRLASAGVAGPGVECLVIEYASGDPTQPPPRLYVPVTEAHLVSKYVGTGKARPPLNALGGTRWAKTKEQAERAVRDVAGELLSIQAARESQPGHAFQADTPWQREFESAFVYEETPDQLRAINDAKQDMERPKPMDRLICGDVGFGKTEVAIRAAFKSVMGGRQVAVLVPTTVLAQQHFNTFRERMADYPVRVELLSRFRTRRAQQQAVRGLADGSVDIVIGTHRLIQPDIIFKDLGLVVIDEEQRFGVLHKERFKLLRKLVDVLTLSATPIPRTLYLSLAGARDLSTIQTPPHDRLPVETVVTQYDERIIRDAINRELGRGGQVFFLHNRVLTIEAMAEKLRALVPQARVVVGHGQMQADDLERVMTSFVNGEADVLLSTTIIESGLDIPNANTILIDRADRFGLSDLYQLRGRVGRYKHQAYAYLLLPRHATLLADARRRLSAIKQYSTLGSGFKIAMRDLEIRGAGNLLGSEQSGHITAVGFELYCQLLKQSVAALKGETVKPRVEVQVRLDFLPLNAAEEGTRGGRAPGEPAAAPPLAAYVPLGHVAEARQRIDIYRKLAQLTDKAGLVALEKELRDRFGPPPRQVQLLLQVAELKLLAADRNISLIEVREGKVMLTRQGDLVMVGNKFPRLARTEAGARLKEIRKLLLAL
jgi:transcription-repair coupling factor (superfamily II helicase)